MAWLWRHLDSDRTGVISKAEYYRSRLWFEFTPADVDAWVSNPDTNPSTGPPACELDAARKQCLLAETFGDRERDGSCLRDCVWRVWGSARGFRYSDMVLDLCADPVRCATEADAPVLPNAVGLYKAMVVACELNGAVHLYARAFTRAAMPCAELPVLIKRDAAHGFAPTSVRSCALVLLCAVMPSLFACTPPPLPTVPLSLSGETA